MYRAVISGLLLSMLALTFAFSQEPVSTPEPVPAPQQETVIKTGDLLQVFVWGTEEDLTKVVTVRGDGKIFYPWTGDIPAANLTLNQLSTVIKQKLSKYFKNFEVTVGYVEVKPRFSILGTIGKSGAYDLTPGMTVLEAITLAGGALSPETSGGGGAGTGLSPLSSLQEVRVMRENKEIITLNLAKALQGDLTQNIEVRNGDIIYVGKTPNQVTVLGVVNKEGVFELKEGARISDAVAIAGGFGPNPHLKQVVVIRTNVDTVEAKYYNMEDFLRKGKIDQNILLADKDIIYIPARNRKFTWTEVVKRLNDITNLLFIPDFLEGAIKLGN